MLSHGARRDVIRGPENTRRTIVTEPGGTRRDTVTRWEHLRTPQPWGSCSQGGGNGRDRTAGRDVLARTLPHDGD